MPRGLTAPGLVPGGRQATFRRHDPFRHRRLALPGHPASP
jgi:hypothetical protein